MSDGFSKFLEKIGRKPLADLADPRVDVMERLKKIEVSLGIERREEK